MGNQLWTSPTTGYRRQGTRLEDFNAVLGDRILAKDICEPLRCCPADAPAAAIAAELRARDFDIAGVREQEDSPVIGLVRGASLIEGSVRDHVEKIELTDVVEATVTVRALLDVLKLRPFVFVKVGGSTDAILTRADLNKPMVRVYLFGLISLLEIHMGFWIDLAYADQAWEPVLTRGRLDAAKRMQNLRADEGQKADLLQCLQLCDKRTLVVESATLIDQLGLGPKQASCNFLVAVEHLRNSLAHSQYDLTAGGSWEQVIALTEGIQRAVSRSDQLVEAHAIARAVNYTGALW